MKTSELRLGNWIYGQSESEETGEMINHPCIVRCLDNIDAAEYPIMVESKSNREWFDGFVPIPLTEDILVKCGFEKETWSEFSYRFPYVNGDVSGWVKDNVYCFIPFSKNHKEPCFFGRRNTDDKKEGWNFTEHGHPLFLHQLQNLYFALTNQELIFNHGN